MYRGFQAPHVGCSGKALNFRAIPPVASPAAMRENTGRSLSAAGGKARVASDTRVARLMIIRLRGERRRLLGSQEV